MEPLSKKDKVDQMAELLKESARIFIDEAKKLVHEHLDKNPEHEIADINIHKTIEQLAESYLEPFVQGAIELIINPVSSKTLDQSKELENDASKKPEKKVAFFGLDESGKTTALYTIKDGEEVTFTVPTLGFNVETIETKGLKLYCWDVGGQPKIRPLWIYYFEGINAVIYFVDGSDTERISESAETFRKLLQYEELKDCIFIMFATKTDLPKFDMAKIETEFGLATLSRPHRVYCLCTLDPISVKGVFDEAVGWLEEQWSIDVKQD